MPPLTLPRVHLVYFEFRDIRGLRREPAAELILLAIYVSSLFQDLVSSRLERGGAG